MRLGAHEIFVDPGSLAAGYYGSTKIYRRHRHRYEFNRDFEEILVKNGMLFSGHSDAGRRTEILEVPNNKFYLGVQYHAEFNSRPGKPEQAFSAFIRASAAQNRVQSHLIKTKSRK